MPHKHEEIRQRQALSMEMVKQAVPRLTNTRGGGTPGVGRLVSRCSIPLRRAFKSISATNKFRPITMATEAGKGGKAHVLVLAYPATGHTNPLLQFAKNLASRGLLVTFVTFTFNHERMLPVMDSLRRLRLDVRFESIPDGLPVDPTLDSNLTNTVFNRMHDMDGSALEQLIHPLHAAGNAVSCIIHDSFLPWVADVANKFNIPRAFFWTQSAAVASIYYHYRYVENWDPARVPEVVRIPCHPHLRAADLPYNFFPPYSSRGTLRYFFKQMEKISDATWVLANSLEELEGETMEYMRRVQGIDIRPIGPSIPSAFLDGRNPEDRQVGGDVWKAWECTEWLNGRPPSSVIYVSFGSITVISRPQIEEIAEGLQRSHQHFVWVIRPPPGHLHISDALPAGFVEETKEKGLVVPWVRQMEVLSHPSVGAFMTHSGWNSTLDGLSSGVPLLCLGVWSDQITNSKFVSDVWKAGLRMRKGEDGIVGREEIERCVRLIMEGEECAEIRKNAQKWGESARKAMMEGGSSDANLNAFVEEIVGKAEAASPSSPPSEITGHCDL